MSETRKKILVVEDERELRENITELLNLSGYQPISAENGRAALDMVLEENPDLILSDILMPEFSGYDFLNRIQKEEALASIPFIFLSAKADSSDIRKGMNMGADDYIPKPFSVNDLVETIEARLQRHKVRQVETERLRKDIVKYIPHELRTPLVAILGLSQLIDEEIDHFSCAEVSEMAGSIRKSGIRLHDRIEKFLIVVELENYVESGSTSEIIRKVSNRVKKEAEKLSKGRGRFGDLHLNLEEADILFNERFFKIVINEILSNALKFSSAGDTISIIGRKSVLHYELEIKDSGKGITEEQILQLGAFKQFEKDKYQQEGNGLGICIVKKALSIFGGNFRITSKKEKFTKVAFTFNLSVQKEKFN